MMDAKDIKIAALETELALLQEVVTGIVDLLEDRLLQMPQNVEHLPMFLVIEDSPAWEALCRVVRTTLPKAGRIYPIKRAEFQSLKTDLLAIGLGPKEETDNGT